MAFEQREGSGSLFKSDQKGNANAPGYRGDLLINGVLFELAAWVKTTQKGDKFFSLSAKVKGAKYEAKPKPAEDDLESDLPF